MGHKFVSVFALRDHLFYSMWNEMTLGHICFNFLSCDEISNSKLGIISCWLAEQTSWWRLGTKFLESQIIICSMYAQLALVLLLNGFLLIRRRYWQLNSNTTASISWLLMYPVSQRCPVRQSHSSTLDQNRCITSDFNFGSQVRSHCYNRRKT